MASGERRPGINFFALLNDNVRKMKYEVELIAEGFARGRSASTKFRFREKSV